MTCPHQAQPPGKDTGRRLCAIGLFGGKPWIGNCMECGGKPADYKAPARGLGDVVERIAKPIAKALNLPCLDKSTGQLRPESGCAKRRDRMNKAIPFKYDNNTPDPTASGIPEEVSRTDGTQGVGSP